MLVKYCLILSIVIPVSAPCDIALRTATTLSSAASSADRFGSRLSHHFGSRLVSSCFRRSLLMFLTMFTWPLTYRTTCSADRTRQYATINSLIDCSAYPDVNTHR